MELRDPLRAALSGLLFLCLLLASLPAAAEDPNPGAPAEDFGPLITIEQIEISGNSSTDAEVIKAALPIRAGDQMRAGDAKLVAARYRVLALGFFRKVELSLAKGSERGKVILVIEVEERGTIVLNRIYFGTALYSPWWAGLDLGERNFLGTGISVSAAAVVAGKGRADGASAQQSATLRAADSAFFGSRFGWHGSVYGVNASEPYRISGEPDDARIENFNAFDYNRIGGRGGLSLRLTRLARGTFGARGERVHASLPQNPIRTLPNGETRVVDLHLQDKSSRVITLFGAYDRDTRSDPVLPWQGDRLLLHAEFGASVTGSSYDFGSVLAKYERWWPVHGKSHVLSVHLGGGLVFGDVPLFERLHVGDINRMVSPRALGLVTSTTPSLDILNTSTDEISYGEMGGLAEVQYSYKLFESQRLVYGGELFVGAGLWTLATTSELDPRSSPPIDVLLDAGLRLDTEIGIFELSLANALGRLPL
jgi:outer membrane protein assembly factor BamA